MNRGTARSACKHLGGAGRGMLKLVLPSLLGVLLSAATQPAQILSLKLPGRFRPSFLSAAAQGAGAVPSDAG